MKAIVCDVCGGLVVDSPRIPYSKMSIYNEDFETFFQLDLCNTHQMELDEFIRKRLFKNSGKQNASLEDA